MKQRPHKDIIISLAILTGFVFIVSLTIYYVEKNHNNGVCGCTVPEPILIMILSSLGLFVGTLIYYFLSKRHDKERIDNTINAEATLLFLDKDERKVIKSLIKFKGSVNQSQLDNLTGLSRVKVFRILKRLEEKEIIFKEEKGRTFTISLNEKIKKVFD
jgi:hypothetical protein